MKKLLVVSALILTFALSNVSAQYSRAISVDPIDFLVSKVFNATYEHQLSEKNSFTVFASYYSYSEWWSAYGIGGSYRWYLTGVLNDDKTPIEGLSVGPMAKISFWDYSGSDPLGVIDGGSLIVIGAEAAYKFNFGNWFVEPILRLGFAVSELDYLGYDPLGGGVNVGYAW